MLHSFLSFIIYFFSWTLVLYWSHRLCHIIPGLKQIHWHHHRYVTDQQPQWMWQNIFLFSDDWMSTLDIIVTEIIPTLVFCYFTGQWWVFGIYYVWTAFIQEWIEHNKNFNIWPFSAGKFHLNHHSNWRYNYSLFFPIWDYVFGTAKPVESNH